MSRFIIEYEVYITVVSLFIGITGLFLALFFYFKSIRVKRMSYHAKNYNILTKSLSGLNNLSISFAGEIVKELTATKIIIWNSGDLIMDKNDVIELAPIVIKSSNDAIKIYEINILSFSDESNNFKLTKIDSNIYQVEFDYIESSQGVSINVLHSGNSNDEILVVGKMKSAGSIKYRGSIYSRLQSTKTLHTPEEYYKFVHNIEKRSYLLYLLFCVLLFGLAFKYSFWLFILSAFFALSAFMIYPKKAYPKELED